MPRTEEAAHVWAPQHWILVPKTLLTCFVTLDQPLASSVPLCPCAPWQETEQSDPYWDVRGSKRRREGLLQSGLLVLWEQQGGEVRNAWG